MLASLLKSGNNNAAQILLYCIIRCFSVILCGGSFISIKFKHVKSLAQQHTVETAKSSYFSVEK